jgi:hypothetical protein
LNLGEFPSNDRSYVKGFIVVERPRIFKRCWERGTLGKTRYAFLEFGNNASFSMNWGNCWSGLDICGWGSHDDLKI